MGTASLHRGGYVPVSTASLCPAAVLDCDLYLQRPGAPCAELYRASSYPLEATDLDRLRAEGVDQLYIRPEASEAYRHYLCNHVLQDKKVPLAARVQALREVTRVAFDGALAANDFQQMISVAAPFGGNLAAMLAERQMPYRELLATLEHDYGTFTHVCNVSVYCTTLAIQLGVCPDAVTLGELATGALLHDVGKRHISTLVIKKVGQLTDYVCVLIR